MHNDVGDPPTDPNPVLAVIVRVPPLSAAHPAGDPGSGIRASSGSLAERRFSPRRVAASRPCELFVHGAAGN